MVIDYKRIRSEFFGEFFEYGVVYGVVLIYGGENDDIDVV